MNSEGDEKIIYHNYISPKKGRDAKAIAIT